MKELKILKQIAKTSLLNSTVNKNNVIITNQFIEPKDFDQSQFISKKSVKFSVLQKLYNENKLHFPLKIYTVKNGNMEPKNPYDSYIIKNDGYLYLSTLKDNLILNQNKLKNIINSRQNIFKTLYLIKKYK